MHHACMLHSEGYLLNYSYPSAIEMQSAADAAESRLQGRMSYKGRKGRKGGIWKPARPLGTLKRVLGLNITFPCSGGLAIPA